MGWSHHIRFSSFGSVFGFIASECGLFIVGRFMNAPSVYGYMPVVFVMAVVFWSATQMPIATRIQNIWSRMTSCFARGIVLSSITALLTAAILPLARIAERRIWEIDHGDKIPELLSVANHIVISAGMAIAFVVLYAWSLYQLINEPDKVGPHRPTLSISHAIEYIRDKTEFGAGKADGELVQHLRREVAAGRLRLWARRNNKTMFIRPRDFRDCFFETPPDNKIFIRYLDGSKNYGVTFSRKQVMAKWPPKDVEPLASDQ